MNLENDSVLLNYSPFTWIGPYNRNIRQYHKRYIDTKVNKASICVTEIRNT